MYAILCPLKSEYIIAKEVLSSEKVLMAVGGHGKVNYGVKATQLLLENPSIQTLICLGGGGSLSKTVRPLDVVVASKTIEHDYREKFSLGDNLPQIKSEQKFLDQLLGYKFKDINVHIGPIASGDEDIISQERIDDIVSRTNALAVGWEGIGGAKACRHLGKSFIEVRGITDSCQSSSHADFSENLVRAMTKASEVVKYLIEQS